MWINAEQITRVLMCGPSKAYQIIKELKAKQAEKGYYTNPNAKIPVRFFCECYGLDEDEVRKIINSPQCTINA